jgi:hypothetical protein
MMWLNALALVSMLWLLAGAKLVAAKMSRHQQLLRFAATTTSQTLLKSNDE